jgi:hypothetical protein
MMDLEAYSLGLLSRRLIRGQPTPNRFVRFAPGSCKNKVGHQHRNLSWLQVRFQAKAKAW